MAPTPTRREIVLVGLLLVFIFFFAPSGSPEVFISSEGPSHSTNHSVSHQTIETRLSWGTKPVPSTKILAHVPGWTVFDRLYVLNGIVYVVTDEPDKAPDVANIYSKGLFIYEGFEAEQTRLPGDDEIQIISTKKAHEMFGSGAQIIDGVTFLINDPPQFITHYYHWSAELFFGLWRTYSSLDPGIVAPGANPLPPPRRIIFNRLDAFHWRDYADMNQWVVRSSLPSLTMEFKDDWNDRASMSSQTNTPFVFERVVVADRSAAMLAYNYARYQRTAAVPFGLPGGPNWWMSIRDNVVTAAGVPPSSGGGTTSNPVITYISRQDWGRRMLIPADHDRLVKELYKLRDDYGWEVNVVSMDKMSRQEQLRLAARTTIMMGVHGNGLTSLLWMNPSPRSTVMEFFFPGGFAHDYEYTTRAMGMMHYGFWGSESFTSPGYPTPKYVEGFQGNAIPIDGAAVAQLCIDRLTLSAEEDD